MQRIRKLLKKLYTPVTIILIPHTSRRTINFKMPSIGLLVSVLMSFIGVAYVFSVAVDTVEYHRMRDKLNFYKGQFVDLKSTIFALKKAEKDFNKLFSLGSKDEVLENLNFTDSGAIDMEALNREIRKTMEDVAGIKEYLSQQKDLYMATPKGLPAAGRISSGFGMREHPIKAERDFHTGLDISVEPGHPVRATADGMVTFSGWSGASGNLVAVEHGFGFSTFYAHNRKNEVNVGQAVKRGDVIAYAGSTGSSTGPHVHYEIWRNGKLIDPKLYIEEAKN